MAQVSNLAMALASQSASIDIPRMRDVGATKASFSAHDKHAVGALMTPPNSISPNMPAHGAHLASLSAPLLDIAEEIDLEQDGRDIKQRATPPQESAMASADAAGPDVGGMPLSVGALSGLDASAAITPSMLAKDHLPAIMLGNGPKPIRHVIGELTHTVPGFSRIPPAKARRLVVAALESRGGGGPDGNVTFCKIGWGRWDAHVKGSSRDSAIGSFNDGRFSPSRSELSSYAVSHDDSGVHIPGPGLPRHYGSRSHGDSWTNSASLREADELDDDDEHDDIDMDMDVPENEADKMSLDEDLPTSSEDDDDDELDDATDEEDWAAAGPAALRKASLPTPGMPRRDYQSMSVPIGARWPSRSYTRRPSGFSEQSSWSSRSHNPFTIGDRIRENTWKPDNNRAFETSVQTPEEQVAIEALLKMGSV